MSKGQQQAVEYDELYTPAYAVKPLVQYIPKGSIIWECTSDNNNIAKVFRRAGFTVIETHKDGGLDFLTDQPDFDFDVIITNPPYSKRNKEKFLQRCYEYNKPFALLLPNTALNGVIRNSLYSKYNIEVLVFNRRTTFTIKDKHWKWSNWYCWKLLPPTNSFLVFHDLIKEAFI